MRRTGRNRSHRLRRRPKNRTGIFDGGVVMPACGSGEKTAYEQRGPAQSPSPVLRSPFEEQDGRVVPQLVALVVEDGLDEQP